jgi:metal-responsive CopG/Arc/MetJ family transcriptional regulator
MMTKKERITITICENLLKEIEKERGLIPRSTFIELKLKNARCDS